MRRSNSSTVDAGTQGREVRLEATDGYSVGATLFDPAKPRGATVIIHGATAVRQRFYQDFAMYLMQHGFRVVTYDYRGIGASAPAELRGFRARMSDWAQCDARAVMGWARQTYPQDAILFVGHSFGGQMIGILDELRQTSGALLVACQLGHYKNWPTPHRLALGALWYGLVPAITQTTGYLPGKLGLGGVDLPAGVALEWAKWCRHPDYLAGYVEGAVDRFSRFDRPTLLLSFEDDPLAPPRAVRQLRHALGRAPLRHRHIDPAAWPGALPLGHMGFFRKRTGEVYWGEALEFLRDVADGRIDLAQRSPVEHEAWAADVAADLAYGRD